jgi:hypothetical protein
VQLMAKEERERENEWGHNFMEEYFSSPSLIIINAKLTSYT